MKEHAGVDLRNDEQVVAYSREYLAAFKNADRYFWFPPWSPVYGHYARSHEFMIANFSQPRIDSRALDVHNNIWSVPWPRALRGLRLLIISSFASTMERQCLLGDKLFGVDLFPECTFRFLKPPQTHAGNPSRAYSAEMAKLRRAVKAEAPHFDVALCACGGYGAPLCHYIHGELQKSAIYVGGVLQIYFGIVGSRWERESPDAVATYSNQYWTRPSPSERPAHYGQLEKACYW